MFLRYLAIHLAHLIMHTTSGLFVAFGSFNSEEGMSGIPIK